MERYSNMEIYESPAVALMVFSGESIFCDSPAEGENEGVDYEQW